MEKDRQILAMRQELDFIRSSESQQYFSMQTTNGTTGHEASPEMHVSQYQDASHVKAVTPTNSFDQAQAKECISCLRARVG